MSQGGLFASSGPTPRKVIKVEHGMYKIDGTQWTPEKLQQRIAEGEKLLAALTHEPEWMRSFLHRDLEKKRRMLVELRSGHLET